jgi:hypothetical protein
MKCPFFQVWPLVKSQLLGSTSKAKFSGDLWVPWPIVWVMFGAIWEYDLVDLEPCDGRGSR